MFTPISKEASLILQLFIQDLTRKVYNPEIPISGKSYSSAICELKRLGLVKQTSRPVELTTKGVKYIQKLLE